VPAKTPRHPEADDSCTIQVGEERLANAVWPPVSLMVDSLSPLARSRRMALIRSRDTKPEKTVRRVLHSLGYRFRVAVGGLPGRPDVTFTNKRKVIFVHGCFWHSHRGCNVAHIPKTRSAYWESKFAKNVARDVRNQAALLADGWSVLTVWECEIDDGEWLRDRLISFLGPRRTFRGN